MQLLIGLDGVGLDIVSALGAALNDDALEARYGIRVPVLRRGDGAELDWPFDVEAVRAFVASS